MDGPIQKFVSSKSVISKSNCICEIENFANYKYNEKINSAKVDFFGLHSEWRVEILPELNNGFTYFNFKIKLNSAIVCQLKNLQCRISGTCGSLKLFVSGFANVGKEEITTNLNCGRQTLLNCLSKDGLLTVVLQVELQYNLSDPITLQKQQCSLNAKLQLSDQYSSLLNDPTYSDFTFIVQGKSFKVHKNVLASVSEIMRTMFAGHFEESTVGTCHVDHIEPNVFQNMLQFIYAGIIPVNLEDVSISLYKAAHYYRIVKLLEICKEDIHFRLTSCNALDVYELATMYDIEDMRLDAWKIVKSQCFNMFLPFEPLPLEDFQEIRGLRMREMEILLKHKKGNVDDPMPKN